MAKSSQILNHLRLARDISLELGFNKTVKGVEDAMDIYGHEAVKKTDEAIDMHEKKERLTELDVFETQEKTIIDFVNWYNARNSLPIATFQITNYIDNGG